MSNLQTNYNDFSTFIPAGDCCAIRKVERPKPFLQTNNNDFSTFMPAGDCCAIRKAEVPTPNLLLERVASQFLNTIGTNNYPYVQFELSDHKTIRINTHSNHFEIIQDSSILIEGSGVINFLTQAFSITTEDAKKWLEDTFIFDELEVA